MNLSHLAARIEIFRGESCWLARFVDAPRIERELGTDTLPCAFAPSVPSHQVLRELRRLNPGVLILHVETLELEIAEEVSAR